MDDRIETQTFDDADAAVARIAELYEAGAARLRDGFARVAQGQPPGRWMRPGSTKAP